MGVVLTADYPGWLSFSSQSFSSLLSRVCCLWAPAPKADPVFLLSYFAASEVRHGRGALQVIRTVWKRSHQCVLHNNRQQLRTVVYHGEGDNFIPTSVKPSHSFIKCASAVVSLSGELGRPVSPGGESRVEMCCGSNGALLPAPNRMHGLKQTACWEMSRWFWVSTEISEDLKS